MKKSVTEDVVNSGKKDNFLLGAFRLRHTKVIYTVFFIAFLILILRGTIVNYELNKRSEATDWLIHTYQVINQIDYVLLNFTTAERQFQLYLNTHNKKYLTLYHTNILATQNGLIQIRLLTLDNVNQQLRLNTADEVIKNHISLLQNIDHDIEKVKLPEITTKHEQSIIKFTSLINEMTAHEHALLKQRHEKLGQEKYRTLVEIVLTIVLGYIFLMLAFVAFLKLAKKNEQQHIETLKLEQEKLKLQETLRAELEFSLFTAHLGFWNLDLKSGQIERTLLNDQIFGYKALQPVWTYDMFIKHIYADDRQIAEAAIKDSVKTGAPCQFQCRIIRADDNSIHWIEVHGKIIQDDKSKHMLGLVQDITELKTNEIKLKDQAEHDDLTGLVTRLIFEDRLIQAIAHSKRQKCGFAVLFLDIDGFKQINDTYGHATGDLLLIATTKSIQGSIRESDTLARFGGDEFALILLDIKEKHDVIILANKIIQSFSNMILIDNKKLKVTLSIGISLYPQDGDQSLIEKADAAMYLAKKNGKNNFRFFEDINEHGS